MPFTIPGCLVVQQGSTQYTPLGYVHISAVGHVHGDIGWQRGGSGIGGHVHPGPPLT